MRIRTITSFVLALLIALLGSNLVQSQSDGSGRKVFGYQDAGGGFHPLTRANPDTTSTAATTGTYQITLNITVKSTFPPGTTRTILCSADMIATALSATASITEYTEAAYVKATGSGTSFSCVLTIPYSWIIPSTSIQKSIMGSYSVQVGNSTASAGPPVLRMSMGDFLSTTTVPATGSTTKYTVSVTI